LLIDARGMEENLLRASNWSHPAGGNYQNVKLDANS